MNIWFLLLFYFSCCSICQVVTQAKFVLCLCLSISLANHFMYFLNNSSGFSCPFYSFVIFFPPHTQKDLRNHKGDYCLKLVMASLNAENKIQYFTPFDLELFFCSSGFTMLKPETPFRALVFLTLFFFFSGETFNNLFLCLECTFLVFNESPSLKYTLIKNIFYIHTMKN